MYYDFTADKNAGKGKNLLVNRTVLEERTGFRVTDIVGDLGTLFNYYDLLSNTRKQWVTNSYVDYGLIPICYYPTFLYDYYGEFTDIVLESGINKMYMLKASTFYDSYGYGRKYSDRYDVWVDAKEACNYLGCTREELKSSNLLREICIRRYKQ